MSRDLIYQFFTDRTASWPVIGLVLIVIALVIRHLLLHDLLRDIKHRNPIWFRAVQDKYQKHAALGWLFFLLGMGGFICLWVYDWFLLRYGSYSTWILFFTFLTTLSYLSHILVYSRSIFSVLQDERMREKAF